MPVFTSLPVQPFYDSRCPYYAAMRSPWRPRRDRLARAAQGRLPLNIPIGDARSEFDPWRHSLLLHSTPLLSCWPFPAGANWRTGAEHRLPTAACWPGRGLHPARWGGQGLGSRRPASPAVTIPTLRTTKQGATELLSGRGGISAPPARRTGGKLFRSHSEADCDDTRPTIKGPRHNNPDPREPNGVWTSSHAAITLRLLKLSMTPRTEWRPWPQFYRTRSPPRTTGRRMSESAPPS